MKVNMDALNGNKPKLKVNGGPWVKIQLDYDPTFTPPSPPNWDPGIPAFMS